MKVRIKRDQPWKRYAGLSNQRMAAALENITVIGPEEQALIRAVCARLRSTDPNNKGSF